jgi:hypothetical protein
MTCVVGAIGKPGVLLAGDAQWSTDASHRIGSEPKAFQLSDLLAIAYCGSGRLGQILSYHLTDSLEDPPLGMDEHYWAVREFVPYLRDVTQAHGHLHILEETRSRSSASRRSCSPRGSGSSRSRRTSRSTSTLRRTRRSAPASAKRSACSATSSTTRRRRRRGPASRRSRGRRSLRPRSSTTSSAARSRQCGRSSTARPRRPWRARSSGDEAQPCAARPIGEQTAASCPRPIVRRHGESEPRVGAARVQLAAAPADAVRHHELSPLPPLLRRRPQPQLRERPLHGDLRREVPGDPRQPLPGRRRLDGRTAARARLHLERGARHRAADQRADQGRPRRPDGEARLGDLAGEQDGRALDRGSPRGTS